TIPPLRERPGEVAALAQLFAQRTAREIFADDASATSVSITPEALAALQRHGWPGNIRELRNVIERAVILANGAPIGPEHLLLTVLPEPTPSSPGSPLPQTPSPYPLTKTPPAAEPSPTRLREAMEA